MRSLTLFGITEKAYFFEGFAELEEYSLIVTE